MGQFRRCNRNPYSAPRTNWTERVWVPVSDRGVQPEGAELATAQDPRIRGGEEVARRRRSGAPDPNVIVTRSLEIPAELDGRELLLVELEAFPVGEREVG